jgi:hypothetical protein
LKIWLGQLVAGWRSDKGATKRSSQQSSGSLKKKWERALTPVLKALTVLVT